MNCNRSHGIKYGQFDYDASVDLSNACRSVYTSRVKKTEEYKNKIDRLSKTAEKSRKSSMESAMETLEKEMAMLMEQDVTLMRQLLMMNEAIEDIKNRQLYGSFSKEMFQTSSADILEKD